ncbi:hypothetical protein PINS_up023847 [Pythium insidiosum]|nr:hypothetical protein PINS_up023847 [Pythium insidiosum]
MRRHTVKSIQRTGSTMQFSFAPFFFFFVSSVLYTLYAVVTRNVLMGSTAALSATLGMHYVYVFCRHSKNPQRPIRCVLAALIAIAVLVMHATTRPEKEAQLLIGLPGNALSLLTSASPLLQLRTILRTKDASSLPFGMSVMNVVAGGVWMVYGIMLRDPLISLPNLFALTMGAIQVALILRFPAKNRGVHPATIATVASAERRADPAKVRRMTKSEVIC